MICTHCGHSEGMHAHGSGQCEVIPQGGLRCGCSQFVKATEPKQWPTPDEIKKFVELHELEIAEDILCKVSKMMELRFRAEVIAEHWPREWSQAHAERRNTFIKAREALISLIEQFEK